MKPRFEGELDLRHLDEPIDGKWFITLDSFWYISKDNIGYQVPRDLYTDFASIPRAFRGLISRTGRHGKAAVLHDFLCGHYKVTRKEADQIFLEAMKTLGVGWLKRRTMYFGVRAYSIASRKK